MTQIIVKEYSKDETVEVLETILFTRITEQQVGKSTLGSLETPTKFVEFVWGLNMSRSKEVKTIKKILVNSVKLN